MESRKIYTCEDPASAPRGVALGIMISAALVLAGIFSCSCWLQIRVAFLHYPEAWLGLIGSILLLATTAAAGVNRFRKYRGGWGGFAWISVALAMIALSFLMMVVG